MLRLAKYVSPSKNSNLLPIFKNEFPNTRSLSSKLEVYFNLDLSCQYNWNQNGLEFVKKRVWRETFEPISFEHWPSFLKLLLRLSFTRIQNIINQKGEGKLLTFMQHTLFCMEVIYKFPLMAAWFYEGKQIWRINKAIRGRNSYYIRILFPG